MTEDFKSYTARDLVLSEARKKASEKAEEGLSILDLRKFVLQAMKFTRDKELLKLMAGFHNILSRMEQRKSPKKNLTVHNKKTRR